MRSIITTFGFLIFALSFTSCEDPIGDSYGYNGDWNLEQVYGGITGGGAPVDFNNMNISDDQLSLFLDDLLVLRASVVYGEMDAFGNHELFLDFDFVSVEVGFIGFDIFNDKFIGVDQYGLLYIDDGCCDLLSYSFSRF